MESLGSLFLHFFADTKDLERSLAEARRKAVSVARDIEKALSGAGKGFSLNPKVNHSELYALNKHLDLKEQHFKSVQRYFNSNPLTIRTKLDDSATRKGIRPPRVQDVVIKVRYDDSGSISNVSASKSRAPGSSSDGGVKSEIKSQTNELSSAIEGMADDITKALDKGFKSQKKGLIGEAFNGILMGAAFTGGQKLYEKAEVKVKGAVANQREGRQAYQELSLKTKAAQSRTKVSSGDKSSEAERLREQIKELSMQIDTAKTTAKQTVKDPQKEVLRQQMMQLNVKDTIRPLAQQMGVKGKTKRELVDGVLAKGSVSEIKGKLPYLDSVREQAAQSSQQASKLTSAQLKAQLSQTIKGLNASLKAVKGSGNQGALSDLGNQIEEEYQSVIALLSQNMEEDMRGVLEGAKLQIAKTRKAVSRESQKVAQQQIQGVPQQMQQQQRQYLRRAAQPKLGNRQANYEAIFQSLAKDSGMLTGAPQEKIPKLIVDDKLVQSKGARALYDFKKNQTIISSDIAAVLDKTPQELNNYWKELKDIVHESQHALDFRFGELSQADIAQGAKPGTKVKLMPEYRMVGQRAAELAKANDPKARFSKAYADSIGLIEAQAYQTESKTPDIVQNAVRSLTGEGQNPLQARRAAEFYDSYIKAWRKSQEIYKTLPDLPPETKRIALVSGGFAGKMGKSSESVAQRMSDFIGEDAFIQHVDNPDTDDGVDYDAPAFGIPKLKWFHHGAKTFGKHNLTKGYKEDSIDAAAYAIALARKAKEQGIESPQIEGYGYSAGGYVVQEMLEILKSGGMKAKGVGVGTPHWGVSTSISPENYISLIGEDDPLTVLQGSGGSKNLRRYQNVGKDHYLETYLNNPNVQKDVAAHMGKEAPFVLGDKFEENMMGAMGQAQELLELNFKMRPVMKASGAVDSAINGLVEQRRIIADQIDNIPKDILEDVQAADEMMQQLEINLAKGYGIDREIEPVAQTTAVKQQAAKRKQIEEYQMLLNQELKFHKAKQIQGEQKWNNAREAGHQIGAKFKKPDLEPITQNSFTAFTGLSAKQAKQLEANYKNTFKEIASISAFDISGRKLPGLKVDEKLLEKEAADALYDIENNQIIISRELQQALSQTPQALEQYAEQMKALVHEARHALQFDLGELSLRDLEMGIKPGARLKPFVATSQEAQSAARESVEFAMGVNPKMSDRQKAVLGTVEADAHDFESNTDDILSNLVAKDTYENAFGELKQEKARFRQALDDVEKLLVEGLDRLVKSLTDFGRGIGQKAQTLFTGLMTGNLTRKESGQGDYAFQYVRRGRGQQARPVSEPGGIPDPWEDPEYRRTEVVAGTSSTQVPRKDPRGIGQRVRVKVRKPLANAAQSAQQAAQQAVEAFNSRLENYVQSNYKEVLAEISNLSGIDFDESSAPALVVDDAAIAKAGKEAVYNAQKHQIAISRKMRDILQSNPEALKEYAKKLTPLVQAAREGVGGDAGLDQQSGAVFARIATRAKGRRSNYAPGVKQVVGGTEQGVDILATAARDFERFKRRATLYAKSLQKAARTPEGTENLPFVKSVGKGTESMQSMRQALFGRRRQQPLGAQSSESESTWERIYKRVVPLKQRRQGQALREQAVNAYMSNPNTPKNIMQATDMFSEKFKIPIELYAKLNIKGITDVLQDVQKYLGKGLDDLQNKAAALPYFGDMAAKAVGGLKAFNLAGGGGVIVALRFLSVLTKFAALGALAAQVAVVTNQFDSLRRSFVLTANEGSRSAAAFDRIMQNASNLRIDKAAAIGGATEIAGNLNSRMGGAFSEQVTQAAAESVAIYAADPRQAEQIYAGFGQLTQNSVVSMGDMQALANAMPGSLDVMARSMGMTNAEFQNFIQNNQVLAEDLLPRFVQQLNVENQPRLAGAMDTLSAATNRYNNALVDMQLSVGGVLAPLEKLRLNAMATGLETVGKKGAEIFAKWGTSMAFLALIKFGIAAKNIIAVLAPMLLKLPLVQAGIAALGVAIKSVLPIVLKMAKEFLYFQLAIDAVMILFKGIFVGAGGETTKWAEDSVKGVERLTAAFDKAAKGAEAMKKALPTQAKDVNATGSLLEDTLIGTIVGKENTRKIENGAQKLIKPAADLILKPLGKMGINQFLGGGELEYKTYAMKELEDKQANFQTMRDSGGAVVQKILDLRMGKDSTLNKFIGLEKQLESVRSKRRGISATNPDDVAGLRALREQERKILQEKEVLGAPVSQLQSELASRIKGYEDALAKIDEEAAQGAWTQEAYEQETTALKNSLAEAEKHQAWLNKQIKDSTTSLAALQRQFASLNAELADSNTKLQQGYNATLTDINNAVAANPAKMTPGASQFAQQKAEQDLLEQKLQKNKTIALEMSESLAAQGGEDILSNWNVDFKSTGTEGFNNLAKRAESMGNTKEQEVFTQYARIKELEMEASDISVQLSQRRADTATQIHGLNQQINDYFTAVQRSTAELALSAQEAEIQLAAQGQKNRLKSALLGFQDSYITEFVDGIIESIDLLNQPLQDAIDSQKQGLQNQFSFEDQQKQALELKRSLPSMPTIEVGLDFSQIDSDGNVQKLEQGLQSTVETTKQLSDGHKQVVTAIAAQFNPLSQVQSGIQGSVDVSSELGASIIANATASGDLGMEIDANTLGLTDNLLKSDEVNQSILGVVDTTGQVVGKTNELTGALGGVDTATQSFGVSLASTGSVFDQLIMKAQELAQATTATAAGLAASAMGGGVAGFGAAVAADAAAGAMMNGAGAPSGGGVAGMPQQGKPGSVLVRRTGKKDEHGLEILATTIYGQDGKSRGTWETNSGARGRQQFGAMGTTRSGSLQPIEFGNYSLGGEVAGIGAGVGSSFIPINPKGRTSRANIGFHVDANRGSSPGSAGCIVFKTQAEYDAFKKTLKESGAKELTFDQTVAQVQNTETPAAVVKSVGAMSVPRSPVASGGGRGRFTMPLPTGGNLRSGAGQNVPSWIPKMNWQQHKQFLVNQAMATGITDPNQIKYLLATAEHETGKGNYMREGGSAKYLSYLNNKLGNRGNADAVAYRGAGYSQLTGKSNFEKWSPIVSQHFGQNIDLVKNPDLAAHPDIAAFILAKGMKEGSITGRAIGKYVDTSAGKVDFRNARRTINGIDPDQLRKIDKVLGGISLDEVRQMMANAQSGGGMPTPTAAIQSAQATMAPVMQQAQITGSKLPPVTYNPRAALSGSTVNTRQLSAAEQQQAANFDKQEEIRKAQLEKKLESDQIEYVRQQERNLRQLRSAGRESDDAAMQSRRSTEDLAFEIGDPKSIREQFQRKRTEITRQYDDKEKDLGRTISKTKDTIGATEAALASGDITGANRQALEERLAAERKNLQGYEQDLAKVQKLRGEAIASAEKLSKREQEIQDKKNAASLENAKIETLQATLDSANAARGRGDRTPEVEAIPALEKLIALRKEEQQFKDKLQEIDDREFQQGLPKGSLDKEREEAKAQLKIRQDAAKEAAIYAEKVMGRDNEKRSREERIGTMRSELGVLKEQLTTAKEAAQLNPQDPRATWIPQAEKEIQLREAALDLEEKIAAIEDKRFSKELTNEAADQQIANLRKENDELVKNIELRADRASKEADFAARRAELDNKGFDVDLQNQLTDARAKSQELRGAPGFDPLKARYDIQVGQQDISFAKQMIDLDELELSGKRTKEEIDKLRSAYTELNNISLDNLKAEWEQAQQDKQLGIQQKMVDSSTALRDARASGFSARGMSWKAREIQKDSAIAKQEMSFQQQTADLEKFIKSQGLSVEKAQQLRTELGQLNQVQLGNINAEFDPWTQQLSTMQGAFKGFFSDILTGSKSIGDAFKGMVDQIIGGLADMAAEWLTNKLFGDIFGMNKEGANPGQFYAGTLSTSQNPQQPQNPLNNIVPFTNPQNSMGFATGLSLGTNPMQPMYVSDVSQSPFGDIAGGNLFGGNDDIFGGKATSMLGSIFGDSSSIPVNILSANDSFFSGMSDGLGGVLGGLFGGGGGMGGGLGGIIGSAMSLFGGSGGGMGGGGGLGGILSMGMNLLGGLFADGGVAGKDGEKFAIRNYASGGVAEQMGKAIAREKQLNGGRPVVPAVLTAGERVLNLEQTKRFEQLGGTRILNFAKGGVAGGSFAQAVADKTSSNVNVSVPINIQGGGEGGGADEQRIRTVLDSRVRRILEEESRQGGVLSQRFNKR